MDNLLVIELCCDGEVVGVCSKEKYIKEVVYNYLWHDGVEDIKILDNLTELLNDDEAKIYVDYIYTKPRKKRHSNRSDEEFYITRINNFKL